MVKLIEEKVGANGSQILDLSKFFINVQYGTEAIRLAKKSTEITPDSATGFLTLAIAYRMNFMLEDASAAYAKAVELDPESVTNKRNLAEMKRALGKADEAIGLYRQLLEKDASDAAAQTGLALALLDAGKIKEAEAEMTKSLEAVPNNPVLLTSAAYFYAARGDGEKAVELSKKAIEIDRTAVWGYVAQARGFLAQNKPLEAEKILLAARQYGDFPTLDYELASARLAAGLYREAAEILKRNFTVNKEGAVETYLGNRILADAPNFTDLLSLERRVALFETKAADSEENTNKLKALLQFQQKLEAADATETELALAADEFARGGDNMRLHRQLFAANRLLQKKAALSKVLELTQAAVSGVDGALNVAAPSSAVLADEIYDSRQYAISQNLIVVVPEIPRKTLSAIIRGQIEDITARALLQQNKVSEAIIRLKRALSVLPENSAWSRASYWRLGEALQADGKEREALAAFIKAYNKEIPDAEKRAYIENLYVKVNGSVDGLDALVGEKPETTVAKTDIKPTTETTPESKVENKTETTTLPENVPALTPEKTPEATPEKVTSDETKPEEVNPKPSPTPTDVILPTPSPETTPEQVKTDETKTQETAPEQKKPEEIKSEENTPTQNQPTETKPEPSPLPTPQNVSVVITDSLSQFPPSPKTNKTENKTNETSQQTPQKPLFEPVVINVGKTETMKPETKKTEKAELTPTEEKPVKENSNEAKPLEVVQKTEPDPALAQKSESENKPVEKQENEKFLSGELRPRIIITENTGAKTVTEEISTCKLVVSPESVSLLNGGGSLGLSVTSEGEVNFRQIRAASSSPENVEVRPDAEIGASQNRAFFIIKSVSTKTGAYTVTFEAPCGKKEILVRVR